MSKSLPRNRQHRSGDTFSVDLPDSVAFADPDQEREVEEIGNNP